MSFTGSLKSILAKVPNRDAQPPTNSRTGVKVEDRYRRSNIPRTGFVNYASDVAQAYYGDSGIQRK